MPRIAPLLAALAAAATFAVPLAVVPVHAAITVGAPAAAPGSGATPGLLGRFWAGTLLNNFNAPPPVTATFHVDTVASENTPDTTLSAFLSGWATVTSGNPDAPMAWSSMVIDGYLSIDAPGTRDFRIWADDDVEFYVGGVRAIVASSRTGSVAQTVNFTIAGLYSVRFTLRENAGFSWLFLGVVDPDFDPVAPELFFSSLVAPQVTEVPLPGTAWMALAGVALLGAVSRRCRG
jgi:MYXO-CTERM domain-containing protein